MAQNVGIGTTAPTRAGLVVNSKVGTIHAIFGDNTSGVSIESNWPGIGFNNYYSGGFRRPLSPGFVSGMEMNPATGLLSIYTSSATTNTGGIAPVATRMTISPFGNVGIGVIVPEALLHINGNMKINGSNYLEFGAGIAGKEVNAGKIGYALFSTDAVDMVGASVGGSLRKIRFWAEGGSRFEGPLNVSNINSYAGLTSDNININANTTTSGFTKMGTNSMGLKTMTVVVPITRGGVIVGTGSSYGFALMNNIPIDVRNIVSHTGHAVYQEADGQRYSFPLFGHDPSAGDFGAGGYRLLSNPDNQTALRVRFDDCDLCEKNARFVLHIVYTNENLLL